ncbi:MAG TPA: MFS transporter [Verrucomicrobiales bacterium]|nr:MFS transporter [Verrucomicrobiales bacterium]
MFISRFGAFVLPFLTIYLKRLGYSLDHAALAIGCYGAGNFGAAFLGGDLADRIGRRKTIVISMFSSAAALMLLYSAKGLPAIFACVFLAGLTSELYRPASSALIADLVPPSRRVLAFGVLRFAINAGWALGPATAGLLAAWSFFWIFAGNALASVLFGLLAWIALPKGVRGGGEIRSHGLLSALRHVARDRNFILLSIASFATAFIFFQTGSSYSIYVTEHLSYSELTYGLLVSLNGVLIVLLEIPLTFWTRRMNPLRPMALGYLLLGAGFGMNALGASGGLIALAAAMSVHTIGEMIAFPVQGAYAAGLAPAHMRGRYLGLLGMTFSLALIISPFAGARIYAIHPDALWWTCVLLGGVAAASILGSRVAPASATVEAKPQEAPM